MAWLPILDGVLADAAHGAVRDIASTIGRHCERPEDLVLFWAYAGSAGLGELDVSDRYRDAADQLLARVERGGLLSLYGGLAGIGWTLAHVGDPDDCEELLDTIDTTLIDTLTAPWEGHCDLLHGLAGIGVYFLERLESGRDVPRARAGLDRVVAQLVARSTVSPPGLTWFTAPAQLPAWQRELAPNGYYNCGVAHGVPGILAMLARAAAISQDHREPAERALRWLDAQRLPTQQFAAWIAPGVEPTSTRTGWCYGDPGVATAAWSAAVRIGAPIEPWCALARDAARRAGSGVRDACLCHGAIGLAHLFNRCFQASREPIFRESARAWFERGLAMRRHGEGVGGFLLYDDKTWVSTDSFLEGAAGIGLALLAALGDHEPAWDRWLSCDLPIMVVNEDR